MYQRPTAPLSIGGVLDDGFRLLKASFTRIIGLSLVSAFLSTLPSFMLGEVNPEEANLALGSLGLATLVTLPLGLILLGAMVARIGAVTAAQEMSLGDALGIGVRRFLPMLAWVILYVLAVAGASLLLLIPGIILGLSMSLGLYLVILDRQGPVEALKGSHRLVWGNWWRTATLVTVIIFILGAAYVLLGVVAGFGALVDEQLAVSNLTGNVVTVLVTAVINPVSYCFSMAILNDLKLRKEGADLEQRIGELEAA